jgi:D-alanyl-D-alanine carboxypeptidase (penicillin-binding protein 5/6)
VARKTFVGAAQRDGRRLVVAMMYGLVKEGGPTYWDQATGLLDWGFAQDRSVSVGAL